MKKHAFVPCLKAVLIAAITLFSMSNVRAQDTTNLWTAADRQYSLENMRRTRDAFIKETENLTPGNIRGAITIFGFNVFDEIFSVNLV